jgi:LDH2 family malate/lactate/ureidoglycolate dehydrogenase
VLAGSGSDIEKSYGYLVIAIKPDLLMPLDEYRRQMSATLAEIKAAPRLPGVDEIRLPSERAFRERARSRRDGIVIDRRIFEALKNLPQRTLPEKT